MRLARSASTSRSNAASNRPGKIFWIGRDKQPPDMNRIVILISRYPRGILATRKTFRPLGEPNGEIQFVVEQVLVSS